MACIPIDHHCHRVCCHAAVVPTARSTIAATAEPLEERFRRVKLRCSIVRRPERALDLSTDLLDFFRREFHQEEHSGFPRLSRVPDSHIMARLAYYRSLSEADRLAFADCSAHWARARYGFVVNAPISDHTKHPFFSRWSAVPTSAKWSTTKSVPLLRAAVQQYKIDTKRGVQSSVTEEQFEFASKVRSVKASELRKRVRAALKPLGYYKIDKLGYYCCRKEGREFQVHVDYGGRIAQLRYVVARREFKDVHPMSQFRFEQALGFGQGDWDFIVDENVDDAFVLFADLVGYSDALPDRIRAEVLTKPRGA